MLSGRLDIAAEELSRLRGLKGRLSVTSTVMLSSVPQDLYATGACARDDN